MKIRDYLAAHPEIDREEFWRKVRLQYTPNVTEDAMLTNYMVWMDKPFWWIERIYDIAYWRKDRVGDMGTWGTTYDFLIDTEYNEKEAEWLTSEAAEAWYNAHKRDI